MLCMALLLGMTSGVFAAGPAFSDITDPKTVRDAEILRLMGVMEGYDNGTFKPGAALTRAQFCKMAIWLLQAQDESAQYQNMTVFPDVKPSHWASAYINQAAKGQKIITGHDDGLFRPDAPITSGQAVTILLRMLGCKDEEIGGVWPESYMAAAKAMGLLDEISIANGRASITRAQAAALFVNTLTAEGPGEKTLYSLSDETIFKSISASTGKMNCSGGTSYTMVNKLASSALTGLTGRVVLSPKGKALTFIPAEDETVYDNTSFIIVAKDGSTDGFASLAEGSGYRMYRNGKICTPADIRKWDVATYDVEKKVINLSDERINAFYEYCSPDAAKPEIVYLLGGNTFDVLEDAVQNVAAFKPGQQAVFLFTAEGKIAGAAAEDTAGLYAEPAGTVDKDGYVTVTLCGQDYQLPGKVDKKFRGEEVLLMAYTKDGAELTRTGKEEAGDGVVIVAENGSAAGFDALTGGADYSIYKNGVKITKDQIKKYDVATYDRAARRINLCDARVNVYYEDCTGSPKAPDTITIMGGQEFTVLDAAKASVGQYKPGKSMLVLFTSEGKIAGAVKEEGASSNLLGVVSKNGKLTVSIGEEELELGVAVEQKFYSSTVKLSSFGSDKVYMTATSGGDVRGHVVYGKVTAVESNPGYDDEGNEKGDVYTFTIDDGTNSYSFTKGFLPVGVSKGKYIAINVALSGEAYSWCEPMAKLPKIANSAWVGGKAVTYGSETFAITDDTTFYNLDTQSWSTREKCLEYSETTTMYVYDGEVRIVEFSAE